MVFPCKYCRPSLQVISKYVPKIPWKFLDQSNQLIPGPSPPYLFSFFESCWKNAFWPIRLLGSYLLLFCSKFEKLHEVWKGFFKGFNLRPTPTFSLNSFRSYGSTKEDIELVSTQVLEIKLLSCNLGNDPSSRPKIANDTHLFSQPTLSMPWGHRSAIWDPGGPHQTPQTTIRTLKATQFSLSTFNIGKDPSSHPKIANDTHIFSQPTIHAIGA